MRYNKDIEIFSNTKPLLLFIYYTLFILILNITL